MAGIDPEVAAEELCLQRFSEVAKRFEIKPDFCKRLRKLDGKKSILLVSA